MSVSTIEKLPNHDIKHIAFIMDGNRRWAKSKNLSILKGHEAGIKSAKNIVLSCKEMGIKYITLYAFSTENWNRKKAEIDQLMILIRRYLSSDVKELIRENIKVDFIGDIMQLPKDIQSKIDNIKEIIQKHKGKFTTNLNIALNYGARNEIVRSCKKAIQHMKRNNLDISLMNEDIFSQYLDTYNSPDPDLLIRTAGEHRVSNFLLWQLAYTELYFCDSAWPEFNKEKLEKAIDSYVKRNRNYGK